MKYPDNFPLQNELFLSEPKLKEHKNKEFVINPFVPNAPFLYPLKTKKTIRFSNVFRWWRKGALGTNELVTY